MTFLKALFTLFIIKVILDALAPTVAVGVAEWKEARARRALKRMIEQSLRDRYFGHRQSTIPGRQRWVGSPTRRREEQTIEDLLDEEFLRRVAETHVHGGEENGSYPAD